MDKIILIFGSLSMEDMPDMGFGTYKVSTGSISIVREALAHGYSLIDTALLYRNHDIIGEAISHVDRDAVFITSKIYKDDIEEGPAHIKTRALDILTELKTPYLDLLLLHGPVPNMDLNLDAWEALCSLDKTQFRRIGVSNYNAAQMRTLIEYCKGTGLPMPYLNQIELSPYNERVDLVQLCRSHGIRVQAYASLQLPEDPGLQQPVLEISNRHKVTPRQVLLAWALQKHYYPIPKCLSVERLIENLAARHITLGPEEMLALDTLRSNQSFRFPQLT